MTSDETVREVCAEIYLKTYDSMFRTSNVIGWRDRILSAYEREMAAKDAEIARLKHILKSSCRWIKCHDIYHTSGVDILEEAKEILHDDGEFLFKKGE